MFLNLNGVSAQTNTPLAAGTYLMKVESAEVKQTVSKTGEYLEVWFKVTEGESSGRRVGHRFNIKNATPKAQEIGLSQLKTMLLCAGHSGESLASVNDMIGLTVLAKTKVKQDSKGVDRAEIASFLTPSSKATTATTSPKAGF